MLFNVELCRSWYGAGPWDDLGEAWRARHDPALLSTRDAAWPGRASACSCARRRLHRRPFRAFGGRALCSLADPRRVSPSRLAELDEQAGDTLLTSAFLARNDSLRILALLTADQPLDPAATDGREPLACTTGWPDSRPMPLPRAA